MAGSGRSATKVTRLGIIQRTIIVSFGDDFTFKSHGRDGLHQILRCHRIRLNFGRVGIERDTHRLHSRHARERFFDRAAAPTAHHARGNLEILNGSGSHGQVLCETMRSTIKRLHNSKALSPHPNRANAPKISSVWESFWQICH
jgi:hypothetical protein